MQLSLRIILGQSSYFQGCSLTSELWMEETAHLCLKMREEWLLGFMGEQQLSSRLC